MFFAAFKENSYAYKSSPIDMTWNLPRVHQSIQVCFFEVYGMQVCRLDISPYLSPAKFLNFDPNRLSKTLLCSSLGLPF
jgi:hypothetical protein